MTRLVELFLRICAIACTVGLLAAPVSADSDGRTAYRLDTGDKVRIVVFGEDNLSGMFEIDPSGTVAFPLIGQVQAAGLSLREFEKALTTGLADGFLRKPLVSAEIAEYRPFYILGEVNRPGSYPYVSGMTVLNAVALGGGFTRRARKSNIRITRASDPERRGHLVSPDETVNPGDVITVPERFF